MTRRAVAGARARLFAISLIGGGVLLVLLANAHLVYVATTSQPACVAHTRPGEGAAPGQYSASQSACSPSPINAHDKQPKRDQP
jgi:hypothetical protein